MIENKIFERDCFMTATYKNMERLLTRPYILQAIVYVRFTMGIYSYSTNHYNKIKLLRGKKNEKSNKQSVNFQLSL